MKHTPAPWNFVTDDPEHEPRIEDRKGKIILEVIGQSVGSGRDEANAARIAAAVNFVEGIENHDLMPSYKGLNLQQAIHNLCNRMDIEPDSNPLVALELIMMRWEKVRFVVREYEEEEAADAADSPTAHEDAAYDFIEILNPSSSPDEDKDYLSVLGNVDTQDIRDALQSLSYLSANEAKSSAASDMLEAWGSEQEDNAAMYDDDLIGDQDPIGDDTPDRDDYEFNAWNQGDHGDGRDFDDPYPTEDDPGYFNPA